MGLPAARVADSTAHGGVVTEGASTVQINGLAAARMADRHACAIVQPEHVGGFVYIGGAGLALTALVQRRPGAVSGTASPCTERFKDPNNQLTSGSPNVSYTPSNTIAGMRISLGADNTIMVGNALQIYGTGLDKNGNKLPEFSRGYQAEVLADLAKIATTDIGRKKLASLDASGHVVKIVPKDRNDRKCDAKWGKKDDLHGYPVSLGGSGKGTDSIVEYTPAHHPPGSKQDTKTEMESDIVLFHELCHADHAAHGDLNDKKRDESWNKKWTNEEEYRTITQDENVYRRQRHKPDRPGHDIY